jgi:hypothetical protein
MMPEPITVAVKSMDPQASATSARRSTLGRLGGGVVFSDFAQPSLQGQVVERPDWETGKELDSSFKLLERIAERERLLGIGALGRRRKWMLEDPRVNFAISTQRQPAGVNHLGFQVETDEELRGMRAQLEAADARLVEESEQPRCYARSDKYWVTDPTGIAWETFHTLGSISVLRRRYTGLQPWCFARSCREPCGCMLRTGTKTRDGGEPLREIMAFNTRGTSISQRTNCST